MVMTDARGFPVAEFTYYLGSRPNWLKGEHVAHDVPLFVSATTLAAYASGPTDVMGAWDGFAISTAQRWALDSGAFTALTSDNPNHPWHLDTDSYGGLVTRLVDDMGRMPDFVAPQDMPCEPAVRERTGLTTRQHIEITVENFVYLRENFPFIPWIPVIQGWEPEDYLYCAELYEAAGVRLADEYRVGIGSICRRASVPGIVRVIELFAGRGYRMHGFGVKASALPVIGHLLASADSYAWSDVARKENILMPGCSHLSRPDRVTGERRETDCRNCPRWAQQWRLRVLASMTRAELVEPVDQADADDAGISSGLTNGVPFVIMVMTGDHEGGTTDDAEDRDQAHGSRPVLRNRPVSHVPCRPRPGRVGTHHLPRDRGRRGDDRRPEAAPRVRGPPRHEVARRGDRQRVRNARRRLPGERARIPRAAH